MYASITTDSSKAVEILKQGRVVAFPTGTSYGLAADALQGHALQRLRNLKQRPADKTFTVFINPNEWDTYLALNENERLLLTKCAGKPLTLLARPQENLIHLAQDGFVGLRVIDHPMMAELARAVRVPLTATSANVAEAAPAFTPNAVAAAFPGRLPDSYLDEEDPRGARNTTYDLSLGVILDGGELPEKPATTIAKIVDNHIEIVRPGALSRQELESYLS